MKLILLLLLILSAASVYSKTSALTQDLTSKLSHLERRFFVYHYERRDINDLKFKEHLSSWVDYYWDFSQFYRATTELRGFFAAIDPIASYDWAGPEHEFLLYRVNLPKGLNVLDLSHPFEISQSAMEELKGAGCDMKNETDYQSLFILNLDLNCRKISLSILKELEIDLIKYPFDDGKLAGCRTDEDRDRSAFIVIRSHKILKEDIRVFTHSVSEDEDGGIERSILKTIASENNNFYFPGKTIGKELVQQYKKENLINCTEDIRLR